MSCFVLAQLSIIGPDVLKDMCMLQRIDRAQTCRSYHHEAYVSAICADMLSLHTDIVYIHGVYQQGCFFMECILPCLAKWHA